MIIVKGRTHTGYVPVVLLTMEVHLQKLILNKPQPGILALAKPAGAVIGGIKPSRMAQSKPIKPSRMAQAKPIKPNRAAQAKPIKPSRVAAAKPSATHYTVRRGDTLNSIAKRFDVAANDIQRSNNLPANRPLNPGSKVIIPGRS